MWRRTGESDSRRCDPHREQHRGTVVPPAFRTTQLAGGRPCARSSAAAVPAADHGPGRSMTASADVGIGTQRPVRLATRSSTPGLWPTRTTVATSSGSSRTTPRSERCGAGVHAVVFPDRRRDRELGGRESPGLPGAFGGRDDSQVDDSDVVREPSAGHRHLTLSPSRQWSQAVGLACRPVRLAVPQQDQGRQLAAPPVSVPAGQPTSARAQVGSVDLDYARGQCCSDTAREVRGPCTSRRRTPMSSSDQLPTIVRWTLRLEDTEAWDQAVQAVEPTIRAVFGTEHGRRCFVATGWATRSTRCSPTSRSAPGPPPLCSTCSAEQSPPHRRSG